LPSVSEQCRIAELLDQAEGPRVKRSEALTQLNQFSQSVFVDMFGSKGFDCWPTLPLYRLVAEGDTINYGVVQPGDSFEGGVPLLRVSDLGDGQVLVDKIKKIDPRIEANYKRSRLHGNEILISCVGSIGQIALTTKKFEGFNIARAVARVPPLERFDRTFVAHYLRIDEIQRYFKRELRTVAQPTLNIRQIAETRIIAPPVRLQREFTHKIEVVERLKESHRAHLTELDALFESLQYRAFRGEL
jgi:type I restriction enzyme S subunit